MTRACARARTGRVVKGSKDKPHDARAHTRELVRQLSSIGLPTMDGFELLRIVHAARPRLPVILITGHPEMLNRLPPAGAGDYRLFKKPFDGQELLSAVTNALQNADSRAHE